MTNKPPIGAREVAELVAQLGRIAYSDGAAEGLTPAQWTALRYFSRANRFSRTVSAFAEFHATTRGTASQTIKCLVAQGYLSRSRCQIDGRSARLDLTDKSRASVASAPLEALVRSAGAVPPSARGPLFRNLERMLEKLAQECGRPWFGVCSACKHLRDSGCCVEDQSPYECSLLGEPLEEAEIGAICVNFEPRRPSGKASLERQAGRAG